MDRNKQDEAQAATQQNRAAFLAGQQSAQQMPTANPEQVEKDRERTRKILRATKVARVKEALGNKIGELSELVNNRQLEGFETSELDGLKKAIKDLSKHLEPLGKILMEAPEGPESIYQPVGTQGPEGLPMATDSDRSARNLGQTSDDDEEEVEEDDPATGQKRKVKRRKSR